MECQESLYYIYIYIVYVHKENQSEWWKPVFRGFILVGHGRGNDLFFWFTGETVPWLAQVESQLNPTVGSDLWVQIDKIDQLNWTFLDDILLG